MGHAAVWGSISLCPKRRHTPLLRLTRTLGITNTKKEQTVSVDLATVGGWVFSVVTAFIAYKAATRAHRDTTRDSDKDIFVAAVTNERAKWREELRRSVAEYMKQCTLPEPDIPELLRLKTDIILRLNPRAREPLMAEKHKFDQQILHAVNALFEANAKDTTRAKDENLLKLEEATQELLKQEWQKSKDEAATGRERSKSSQGSDA